MKTELDKVTRDLDDLDERLFKDEKPRKVYDKYSEKLEARKMEILEEIEKTNGEISNPQKYIDLSLEIAAKLPQMWQNREFWVQQRLQNIVFPERMYYNGKKGEFRTPAVNPVIGLIRQISQKKGQKEGGHCFKFQ